MPDWVVPAVESSFSLFQLYFFAYVSRDAGNPEGTPSSAVPGAKQRAADLTLCVSQHMSQQLASDA